MEEVSIKFEREQRDGIVPINTYLVDAAKRLGIRFEAPCVPAEDVHFCSVEVLEGESLLSPMTTLESEHFVKVERKDNERLGCQVKLEKPGEIVVMTNEKNTEAATEEPTIEEKSEQFKKEFADMPLEKKIASLVQLEAIALGETFSFVINSPFKIVDKLMDVMAEFGLKKDQESRQANRPDEHKAAPVDTAAAEGKPETATESPKNEAGENAR